MTAVTREELDAKIATVEARLDGRLLQIQGLIQNLTNTVLDERSERRESQRMNFWSTLGIGVTLFVTIIGSGIGVYSAVSGSQAALISAFGTGQSSQPQIQIYPVQIPQPQTSELGNGSAAKYDLKKQSPSTNGPTEKTPQRK